MVSQAHLSVTFITARMWIKKELYSYPAAVLLLLLLHHGTGKTLPTTTSQLIEQLEARLDAMYHNHNKDESRSMVEQQMEARLSFLYNLEEEEEENTMEVDEKEDMEASLRMLYNLEEMDEEEQKQVEDMEQDLSRIYNQEETEVEEEKRNEEKTTEAEEQDLVKLGRMFKRVMGSAGGQVGQINVIKTA